MPDVCFSARGKQCLIQITGSEAILLLLNTLVIFLGCHLSVGITPKKDGRDDSSIPSWLRAKEDAAASVRLKEVSF